MVKVPVERKRKSCTTKSRMISPFPHCNNIQCISTNPRRLCFVTSCTVVAFTPSSNHHPDGHF